jgi:hypothetical protein
VEAHPDQLHTVQLADRYLQQRKSERSVCGSELLQPCRCFDARGDVLDSRYKRHSTTRPADLLSIFHVVDRRNVISTCHFPSDTCGRLCISSLQRKFVQRRQQICKTLHAEKQTIRLATPITRLRGAYAIVVLTSDSPKHAVSIVVKLADGAVDQRCWATRVLRCVRPHAFHECVQGGARHGAVACADRTRSRLVISWGQL